FRAEPADDIGLDDGEPLGGTVPEIVVGFLRIEALKQEPGGVAEIEKRLAGLIDEVSAIGTDLELQALDGGLRFGGGRQRRSEQARQRGKERQVERLHGRTPARRIVVLEAGVLYDLGSCPFGA